jgi:hypothetical protein
MIALAQVVTMTIKSIPSARLALLDVQIAPIPHLAKAALVPHQHA